MNAEIFFLRLTVSEKPKHEQLTTHFPAMKPGKLFPGEGSLGKNWLLCSIVNSLVTHLQRDIIHIEISFYNQDYDSD